MKNQPTIVIGDGWAALGAVSLLLKQEADITWITGTGARMLAPLPALEAGEDFALGAEVWALLAEQWGIDCGELVSGSFLREFRNKAFREPAWTKAPTPENRRGVRDESLWEPERRFAGAFEIRFSLMTVAEIEEDIRRKIFAAEFRNLKRIEANPVTAIQIEDGAVTGVTLGSGEKIAGQRVIYADRWAALPGIQGLPKGLAFTRKREPSGVLQATFIHAKPMGIGLQEGFYGALHKETGEEFERHIFGHFSTDGSRSHWTIFLSTEQVEDNHEIAKKLRRLKAALDKMFAGNAWLPEGVTDFIANVAEEQVRFEEAFVFTGGEDVIEPETLSKTAGICFLTDGCGPALAMQQVGRLFELQAPLAQAEAAPNPAG